MYDTGKLGEVLMAGLTRREQLLELLTPRQRTAMLVVSAELRDNPKALDTHRKKGEREPSVPAVQSKGKVFG